MIHVGLSADENFSLALGVCLTSIFESNKKHEVDIHILTTGFSEDTVERIENTARRYNQHVHFYIIDDTIFDGYPLSAKFPKSIYYRYLFPEILPSQIEKVLYLDCDTLVINDLQMLWDIDIYGTPLAAVEDQNGDDVIERNRIDIFDGSYFNSGVLLLNLSYWRDNDCFSKLANFILENPHKCLWPDQDALNVIFHDKYKQIPYCYNFQIGLLEPFESIRLHKSKRKEIEQSLNSVVIIHFVYIHKPWFRETALPFTELWRIFLKRSLWSDKGLCSRNPLSLRIRNKVHMLFGGEDNLCVRSQVNPLLEEAYKKIVNSYN